MLPLGLVIFGSYVVLLLRFGVLSAIVGAFTADMLLGPPLDRWGAGPAPRPWWSSRCSLSSPSRLPDRALGRAGPATRRESASSRPS